MTYDEAVAYLDYHAGRGIRPGLAQIQGLLELMGNPHLTYPVIHVTGSKGKSSTAAMITMLAGAHGLSVGTYTSPHLETVQERLSYNGLHATAEEFAQAVDDVRAFDVLVDDDPERRLTYFEFVTAVGFAWFADRAVDLGVIEVGLGGRLDATNVVQSAVAVVASIALEHTSYLGDTLAEIATEKAAILKPGGTLVTGELPPEASAVMEAKAAELGSPHLAHGRDFQLVEEIQAVGGWDISVDGVYEQYEEIHIPIHGRHQLRNAAVAVAATEAMLGRALDPEAVREGFGALTVPGRLEVAGRRPLRRARWRPHSRVHGRRGRRPRRGVPTVPVEGRPRGPGGQEARRTGCHPGRDHRGGLCGDCAESARDPLLRCGGGRPRCHARSGGT